MVLVDKGTGRLMEMTKLQGGLHQAIEAKEHVKLSPETRAMASITYQSPVSYTHLTLPTNREV